MSFAIALLLSLQAAPSTAALYQKSYELEVANDPVGALATLERIPAAEHGRYIYRLRRGWLLYLGARHGEAVQSYEKAIALAPESLEPKSGIMLPLMALRRWQDALRHGESVLAKAPGAVGVERRVAFCLYNLGRFVAAEKRYRAIVTAYPSDVEMVAGVGWSLLKQGRADEARQMFARVLAIAPNDPGAKAGMLEASRKR